MIKCGVKFGIDIKTPRAVKFGMTSNVKYSEHRVHILNLKNPNSQTNQKVEILSKNA